jgi:hypothetical protein
LGESFPADTVTVPAGRVFRPVSYEIASTPDGAPRAEADFSSPHSSVLIGGDVPTDAVH